MSEEILIRQGAPTLAGIKTGSLFPCPCEDHEALMTDIRRMNRRLSPKGLCLLPLRFLPGQALLYLYRPAGLRRDLRDVQASELLRQAVILSQELPSGGFSRVIWLEHANQLTFKGGESKCLKKY